MLQALSRPDPAADDIRVFLAEQERKTLLRFLTCGSVDDGKSTLIGRLLYDTKLIFEDQLAALERDSRKHGTTGDDVDLALLVDGLEAEREQGITIDVAYRFFATSKRKFIVADTPGHEQYTRNMATGASTADLAVVLVDARKGVLTQTRRHSFIASLLGIRHIALAVNKIDLVGYDQETFKRIVADYMDFAKELGFATLTPIPISARFGDNVTERSSNLPWYEGPSLLEHLENVDLGTAEPQPFRFPVQYVSRPNLDFRGFAGTIASGRISKGDEVAAAKSGKVSRVKRIVSPDGDLRSAGEGEAVTIVLEDEIEVSRGNMLAAPDARPHVADQFTANIVWFTDSALLPGRSYILRTETDQTNVTVTELKYRFDINSFAHEAANSLELNEIGLCNLSTQTPIAFDSYADNRVTGAFILIDRITNATVGAGMILHPLRRAANVHWQALDVTRASRAAQKHQKPMVLWFTGLSGSGKSTIANLLEKKLHLAGKHTYLLDGDNIRHGLNRDLGFTEEDRVENIRRVAEVARLMADAGLIVLVSFISPFRAERRMARDLMGKGEFVEVFVDTPLDECARRDPKGLYAKALKGEIQNFTGIDSPYEAPDNPEIHLETLRQSPEEMVEVLENWLGGGAVRISNTTAAAASDEAAILALFERLALEAGRVILSIYEAGVAFETKADASPVTEADRAAERIILGGLRENLPALVCVAEEECAAGSFPALQGNAFLLVDPLDGTREFIQRRAEFTVNIALVRDGVPEIGVVYAPAQGVLYSGRPGSATEMDVTPEFRARNRRAIKVRPPATPLSILASRSHRTAETDAYLAKFPGAEIVAIGSSLKFCLLAAGRADLYPRFGRTMEWDTAAGDAVLRAAGGMTRVETGAPLAYGKRGPGGEPDFVNPSFIAEGGRN